jgi:ABC-type multidrug transport system fused ATPase/permease subunit
MILQLPLNIEQTQHGHHLFVYLFIAQVIITILVVVAFLLHIRKSIKKRNEIEKKYVKNVADIAQKQLEQLEKIRINTNKREEERSRQWFESEKETLKVLGGVSKLLDLNEKIAKLESSKMIIKLDEIHNIIKRLIEKFDNNGQTKETNGD